MNLQNLRPGAIRRLASRALALSALALAAWACQDTTGPAVSPGDGAAPRLGQASAFHCSTAIATPQGVQKGQFPLHFPSEALAADGSTMPYRYRHQTPSGALTYSADCVIPRTVSAVEMMNRRFQVPPELGAPGGRSRDGGELTIQGCVEEGACELEPIVVVAPAPPSICTIYCGGGGGPGTSPGWDGGSSGGGGGGGGDGSTYDPEEDRTGEWDGSGTLIDCPDPRAGFTDTRCSKIDDAIKWLVNHTDAMCRQLGANAHARHYTNKGYFLWTPPSLPEFRGVYGGMSATLGTVGLTDRAFNPGELANTIAHEESHFLGYPDKYKLLPDGTSELQPPGPDGLYASHWGRKCDSPTT